MGGEHCELSQFLRRSRVSPKPTVIVEYASWTMRLIYTCLPCVFSTVSEVVRKCIGDGSWLDLLEET